MFSASFYSYLKSSRGGTHKASTPAEKLLANDGCWGRKSPFSLEQWILIGCMCSTVHMQAALTGLSENLKEDMKVQGGYVGDQEERKTGGVDMIEIHCIHI